MPLISKLLLLVLITTLSLEAKVQRVKDSYFLVKTAGTTYVGNSSDQTYSINAALVTSGDTIVIIDKGGKNTIELVGGLTISSSKVVSDELVLNLSNGASINIRGADTFTFDVGANQDSSVDGTKQDFSTFVKGTLGLSSAPTKGQAVVSGSSVEAIVDGGSTTNSNANTITCQASSIGDKIIVDGETYTVVDKSMLYGMNTTTDDFKHVCTSHVTDMNSLFKDETEFNQDISRWDTSNVMFMNRMFYLAREFNQDIGNWDTSSVIKMGQMFTSAYKFNQDIGRWDTSSVTLYNMQSMFNYAKAFNQDISGWCVTNNPNEPYNFSDNSALAYFPIWGTCPTPIITPTLVDNNTTILYSTVASGDDIAYLIIQDNYTLAYSKNLEVVLLYDRDSKIAKADFSNSLIEKTTLDGFIIEHDSTGAFSQITDELGQVLYPITETGESGGCVVIPSEGINTCDETIPFYSMYTRSTGVSTISSKNILTPQKLIFGSDADFSTCMTSSEALDQCILDIRDTSISLVGAFRLNYGLPDIINLIKVAEIIQNTKNLISDLIDKFNNIKPEEFKDDSKSVIEVAQTLPEDKIPDIIKDAKEIAASNDYTSEDYIFFDKSLIKTSDTIVVPEPTPPPIVVPEPTPEPIDDPKVPRTKPIVPTTGYANCRVYSGGYGWEGCYDSDGNKQGIWLEHYTSGSWVQLTYLDGLRHGSYYSYSSIGDGSGRSGEYINDKREGPFVRVYYSGRLKDEVVIYVNGIAQ